MGTCEQQLDQHQEKSQVENSTLTQEETNLTNMTTTGPPASRTVIDNLKKLLVQRQHSRESDTENKNVARSNSGSNSDAAFYSQFSTSSSDSDDSSDDYMIFQEISNQTGCSTNGPGANHNTRRRHRRRRSYSSSSSSSPSPVTRSRRKITRVNVTITNSIDEGASITNIINPVSVSQKSHELPSQEGFSQQLSKTEHDSANSTSSHKDSSSENDFVPNTQGNISLSSSAEATGPVSAGRCPKLKSRRDRDRKRKRSELNYATHRPKLLKAMETNTSLHNDGISTFASIDHVSATGGRNENKTSVPAFTASTSNTSSSVTFAAVGNSNDVDVIKTAATHTSSDKLSS